MVELHRHLTDLFDPDPVFSGDTATHLDAEFEDLATERFGAFKFTGHIGIEQDQRVQVTVTGMKHIGHPQVIVL